jgi:ABC-type glycerol-3-phosphate transport system substrate-binding protein
MKKSYRRSNYLQGFLLLGIVALAITSCLGTPSPAPNTPSETSNPTIEPSATENTVPTATETAEGIPNDPTPAPLIENPEDLDGITVRLMHPWPSTAAPTLADIARQFSLTNPWGIWVEVDAYGNEALLLNALQSDLGSGYSPGIVAVHPSRLDNLEEPLATIDLSAYFDDPTWGFSSEEAADFVPVFLNSFRTDEMLHALPIVPSAMVLFYNQTWGEELGFSEPPRTEANFTAVNCASTQYNLGDVNVENDGTGGWLMNFDPVVLLSWYHAFGGVWENPQVPEFSDETGTTAFGSLKSIYDQGCIWIGRRSEPYQYFTDRITLMYAGTLDQIETQTGWMENTENDDQWLVTAFPGPEKEKIMVDSPGLFIPESSPAQQMAAWLFAKHLLSPEIQAALIESSFALPVRQSTMDILGDFTETYPQWAQAVNLLENASMVPTSDEWEEGQWVLQDAIYQIMVREADQLPLILEELDRMMEEVVGD